MADQGEGGVDSNDDMSSRMAADRQRNRELEAEAIKLERRSLEARLERARRKSQADSAFTMVGTPFETGSKTTVGAFMGNGGGNFDVGRPTWSGSDGPSSSSAVGFPMGQIPRAGGADKYAGAKDAEWETSTSGASQAGAKDASDALFGLKVAAAGVSAAFYTVANAAKSMGDSQKKGAIDVTNIENTLGDSFQNLGVNGEDKIAMANTGKRFRGQGDQKTYAELMKRASDLKTSSKYLGPIDMQGIEKNFDKFQDHELTKDQLMSTMNDATGIMLPSLAADQAQGFGQSKKYPTQTPYNNQNFTAALNRKEYENELKNKDKGNKNRNTDVNLNNMERDSVFGAFRKMLIDLGGGSGGVNSGMYDTGFLQNLDPTGTIKVLRLIAGNTSRPAPSTKPE